MILRMVSIKRTRVIPWIMVLSCVVLLTILAHKIISQRDWLLRAMYPIDAVLQEVPTNCSHGSPDWLKHLVYHSIWVQNSPRNQIAYISPDGELFHCENGWVGEAFRSKKVSEKTRFRYASLTKLFTADAILAEINSGSLSLSALLVDVVPELKEAEDNRIGLITVEHLLTHRAGYDRLKRPDPMTVKNKKPDCPSKLDGLTHYYLDYTPGLRYSYSNLGYCLLGVILERLNETSYRELIEDRYHLASNGLVFIDGPYLEDEVSYDFRNSPYFESGYYQYFDFYSLSSSAGLSGSAVPLAKYMSEVMIHRAPLSLIGRNVQSDCSVGEVGQCFGFAVSQYWQGSKDLKLYVQGGHLYGATSKAVFDSYGGVTVWLGSGGALDPSEASSRFVEFMYEELSDYYQVL